MKKVFLAVVIFSVSVMPVCQADDDLRLDNYTCAEFVADSADPSSGNKLLRSLMMISWATGYAASYQKNLPRGDASAMALIATIIGEACQKIPEKSALLVSVEAIDQLTSGTVQSEPPSGALASGAPLSLYWNHNESLVSLVLDGAKQKIFYETPRSGLAEVGVKPGALLFEGQRNGKNFVGISYIFTRTCESQGYEVTGEISDDARQITLKGKAPLLDSNCKITGYRDDILIFTIQPSDKK